MEQAALQTDLQEVLQKHDKKKMKKLFANAYLADLAQAFEEFELEQISKLLEMMSYKKQALLFGYLDARLQLQLVSMMDVEAFNTIFAKMPADERADLFKILPYEISSQVVSHLTKQQQQDLKRLASYDEAVVGAIMTSDYAILHTTMSADEAIESLRKVAQHSETIYQAYVVDDAMKLIGVVSLKDLITAAANEKIGNFMRQDPVYIEVDRPKEEVANVIAKYDLLSVPVVNEQDILVGIVTYDDAMDVASDEASEDFHKIGAMEAINESVKDAPVKVLYQKRVFWLVALVFANILSGLIIAHYEATIAAYVSLVFFLPLLFAAGAASDQLKEVGFPITGFEYGSLSRRCVQFE